MLQLNYKLTDEDYIEFNEFHQLIHSEVGKRNLFKLRLIGPMISILAIVIFILARAKIMLIVTEVIVLCIFSIVCVTQAKKIMKRGESAVRPARVRNYRRTCARRPRRTEPSGGCPSAGRGCSRRSSGPAHSASRPLRPPALGLNNLWILLEDLAIEIKDNIPGYFARITGSANVGNSRIGQLGQIALFDS